MSETPAVTSDSASTSSEFSTRLRSSAHERAALVERERQWLHSQLDELRNKATIEPKRGWSMRRSA